MIRKGEEWGEPADSEPDAVVEGDDETLATWVAGVLATPIDDAVGLVRFVPSDESDLARVLGLSPGMDPLGGPHRAVPLDAMRFANGHAGVAVNLLVFGTAPDRLRRWSQTTTLRVEIDGTLWFDDPATSLVVANGQFLRGLDVSPRGHPADGRVEIQVYRLQGSERRSARSRMVTGTHVPHPRILQRTARRVTATTQIPQPLEVDGRLMGMTTRVEIEVIPGAYRLLL